MSFLKSAVAAAALFAIGATSVIAQTTTPAPTKPVTTPAPAPSAPATTKAPDTTKPAKEKKVKAPQSEISKKCSLEANEKGLKGKPRKTFRKQCMKKAA